MSYDFLTSWRVRFDEVDMQGIVHHTRIVTYLEIARIEYWRKLGISYRQMREDGYEFIVNNLKLDYMRPLIFDEIIEVSVGVKKVRRASVILSYEIRKESGERAIIAETGLACSKVGTIKPTGIPKKYLERFRNPAL